MVHWPENVIIFNQNFSHNADTRSSTSTHSNMERLQNTPAKPLNVSVCFEERRI